MSELTPEREDELRRLAVADTVSLHMRQRLLAALAEIDRLRQRVADLTAGLREIRDNCDCMAVMAAEPCANCCRAARLLAED